MQKLEIFRAFECLHCKAINRYEDKENFTCAYCGKEYIAVEYCCGNDSEENK